MAARKPTQTQKRQLIERLTKRFEAYITDEKYGPRFIEAEDRGTPHPVVIFEDGPSDWTYVVGQPVDGLFCEPDTPSILSVYRDDSVVADSDMANPTEEERILLAEAFEEFAPCSICGKHHNEPCQEQTIEKDEAERLALETCICGQFSIDEYGERCPSCPMSNQDQAIASRIRGAEGSALARIAEIRSELNRIEAAIKGGLRTDTLSPQRTANLNEAIVARQAFYDSMS